MLQNLFSIFAPLIGNASSTMTSFHSKSVCTVHSAEIIAGNDDVLLQILLHLPIKSQAKFKSVSKHWLSLISTTPQFSLPKPLLALLLYQRKNPCNLNLLPLDHDETPGCVPFRSLPFFSSGSWRRIQSCNGLLLCSKLVYSNPIYHVYNPTTNHYSTLPPVLLQEHGNSSFAANIAFDPSSSTHYKVVCFRLSHSSPRHTQVLIYSSETRDWRLSGDSFLQESNPRSFNKGVFWNGAIHWSNRNVSFRFDMEEERIIRNPMPPINDSWEKFFKYFGVSWGHLYLINSFDRSRQHLNVYEMESDCSCWFLKHRIDIGPDLATSFPEIIGRSSVYQFYVLFVAEYSNADDEDLLLVVQIRSEVLCYNMKTRISRKIHDLPPYQSSFHRRLIMATSKIGAYHHMESLSNVW